MQQKIQIIEQNLKTRPVITQDYLSKICETQNVQQTLDILYAYALHHPYNILFFYSIIQKSLKQSTQDIELQGCDLVENKNMSRMINGYANYKQLIKIRNQQNQNGSLKYQFKYLSPLAAFNNQLQRIDVIKSIKNPRPPKKHRIKTHKYQSIVHKNAKQFEKQYQNRLQNKQKMQPKTQALKIRKQQNATAKKQQKQKRVNLPRLNSKQGQLIQSKRLNKLRIDSSQEQNNKEEDKIDVMKKQIKIDQNQVSKISQKIEIQGEQEDEEAAFDQYLKKQDNKPQNISTNLPQHPYTKKKQVFSKPEPKSKVIAGNNQKSLYDFMKKK